ncbi:MAG: TetR/AcrR family transcriptional regulator [Lachnospiraceae bacterium]|nr:TetR/AcrR family transcriptional regulator [Lachnospiraceae bacterium]
MNEKFWDLKKAKQDCMINGSLKVFARCGYRHASTDEIVAEAGVSKGLIFHYFYSKNGLYEFLAEYSARFALVELGSELRREGTLPFFTLQRKLVRAESRILRQYPFMLLFLERAGRDLSSENPEEVLSSTALYTDRRSSLLKEAHLPASLTPSDGEMIGALLDLERSDLVLRLLEQNALSSEKYVEGMNACIQMFERMSGDEPS